MQRLIARVKAILLSPATEWEVIEREPSTAADIYKGYVAPLAAIGVIAAFIGHTAIGITYPILGLVRMGVVAGLALAVLTYVLQFAGVFLIAWIVDLLAPTFDGQRDPLRALKVTAYSFTPAWVAGILNLLPMLGVLAGLIALYALYLLYLGLPVLMRSPKDKAIGYTVVVVLCAIVAWVVIAMLSTCVVGGSLVGAGMMGRASIGDRADTAAAANALSSVMGGKTDADRARVKDAFQTLSKLGEQADKAADKATRSTGATAPSGVDLNAALGAVGTMMAGGKQVEPVDFRALKELLPDALPGMKRDEASGQSGEAMGLKGSSAAARYSDGTDRSIEIEIADLGSLSGLAALAAKFDPSMEKETDTSYERTRRVDGQLVHEQYNRRARSGELSVLAGDRFAVSVRGSGVDADALSGALARIDVARLTKLAATK